MANDAPPKLLFWIAVAIIAIVVSGAFYIHLTAPSEDCANDASARINVLLDRTRPYSDIQKLNLDKAVAEIVKTAQPNAQINVFYMTDDGDRPKTVLSLCRPNDVNALTGDPQEWTFQLQHTIIDPVRKIIDLPLRRTERAPIVETLDTLSRERLVSENNGPNSMYIFSDMIQRSENGSLFGCKSSFDPQSASSLSTYTDKVRQFYAEIPFHVFAIVRNPAKEADLPSSRCLRLFWESTLPDIKTWEPL
jgi:hypothetical protein